MTGTVHQHPASVPPPAPASSGSGNGNGRHLDARVASLEAHLQHLATKNDITQLKVWILGGVLAAIVVAAGISATVVKAFF